MRLCFRFVCLMPLTNERLTFIFVLLVQLVFNNLNLSVLDRLSDSFSFSAHVFVPVEVLQELQSQSNCVVHSVACPNTTRSDYG